MRNYLHLLGKTRLKCNIHLQGVSKHETKHLGEVFAEQKQKHIQNYTGMIYLTFANIQLFAVDIADEKQKMVVNVCIQTSNE